MSTSIIKFDFAATQQLAKTCATSKLMPQALRGSESDIAITILAGAELGLGPMAAIRGIHVVQGKPVLSADAMVAIALNSGRCKYFRSIESTDEVATYETLRDGSEPVRASFTIADAKRAGLRGDNWSKYPAQMLKARAKSILARDVYPDLLMGVYSPDEAESFAEPEYAAPILDVVPMPQADEGVDVELLITKMSMANSLDDLRPIVKECSKFSGADRETLRAAYAQNLARLERGE